MDDDILVTSITDIKKDLEIRQNIPEGFDLTRPIYQYTYLDKKKKEVSAIAYGDEIKFSEIVESYDNYLKNVKGKYIRSSIPMAIKYILKTNIKWIPLYVILAFLLYNIIPSIQSISNELKGFLDYLKIIIPSTAVYVTAYVVNSDFGFKSFNKIQKWLKDEKNLEKFKNYFKEKEKVDLLQLEVEKAILDREKKIEEEEKKYFENQQQLFRNRQIDIYKNEYQSLSISEKLRYYKAGISMRRNFQMDMPKFLKDDLLRDSIMRKLALEDLEIAAIYQESLNHEKIETALVSKDNSNVYPRNSIPVERENLTRSSNPVNKKVSNNRIVTPTTKKVSSEMPVNTKSKETPDEVRKDNKIAPRIIDTGVNHPLVNEYLRKQEGETKKTKKVSFSGFVDNPVANRRVRKVDEHSSIVLKRLNLTEDILAYSLRRDGIVRSPGEIRIGDWINPEEITNKSHLEEQIEEGISRKRR